MFLDRLESGFLLYETEQGLMRVELSFRQRLYLLWTFRNFRKLSVPLLNARQRTLVNKLFGDRAVSASHSYDPWSVIGVIEHFEPPPMTVDSARAQTQAPEQARPEQVAAPPADIEAAPEPISVSLPKAERLPAASRRATARLATTVTAICLGVISAIAWHRIQAVPASQAHNQPRVQQLDAIVPRSSRDLVRPAAAMAESATAIAPLAETAAPLAAAETSVKPPLGDTAVATPVAPAPVTPVSLTSIPVTPAPKPADRVHVATSTESRTPYDQVSGIQATRPPLRFVYPVSPDGGTRGVVSLTAQLDSNGAVRALRVVSGNRALAAAAVRAVRQWRYRPYLKDGQPVATETNVVISFISDDAISMTFPPSIPTVR